MTQDVQILAVQDQDREWVHRLMLSEWGGPEVVVHDCVYRPAQLPGFTALIGPEPYGLITCQIEGAVCEVVTLNGLSTGKGIGSALLEAVELLAEAAGCQRV